MENFFFIDAALVTLGGAVLLISRVRFLFSAQKLDGQVVSKVDRNYSAETTGGLSKHLLIEYQTAEGEAREYVCDNSLLSYVYRVGQPVIVAVEDDRIVLKSLLYLLTAPLFLMAMGGFLLLGLDGG